MNPRQTLVRPLPRVLIVDDELTTRLLARRALERAGFEVVEAEDGAEAVAGFQQLAPQLVLLDVDMPNMDGFEACTRLRAQPDNEMLPILMVTGLDDVASIERAYEVGATDFVTKPINWLILAHRLRYMLRASAALQGIHRSELRLASAQRIAHLGHWEWDIARDETYWSAETYRILGQTPGAIVPTPEALLAQVHPDDRERIRERLFSPAKDAAPVGVIYRIVLPDGAERIVQEHTEVHLDGSGKLVRMSGTVQDITERRQAEEKIRRLACFDSLTGLANRRFFMETLGEALERARRHRRLMAVMFLDLDNFKRINDTLGHGVGDLLLKSAAQHVLGTVRCTDYVGRASAETAAHYVARLGGDEFTVLLDGIRHAADAEAVAQRILAALSTPMMLADQEVVVTPSIGIALFPDDGESVETLLQNADAAMYHAKNGGKNFYRFYAASMHGAALRRLTIENKLRKALEQNEFFLAYQPQIALDSGAVVGVEALLRWQNPELGLVPPEQFVPVAEETGLIVPIGEWVLRQACAQSKAWEDSGLPPLRVAVNLSARQIAQPTLTEVLPRILAETRLPPERLELEITESLLMNDVEEAIASLHTLKRLGVRVAIDDFGTGYSSLSYLKRLPVDRLKIDRSFMRDIVSDHDDAAIVSAMISVAHNLGLAVTVEGVETKAQRTFLKARDCDEMQGFCFSHPVMSQQLADLLREASAIRAELGIAVASRRSPGVLTPPAP